MDKNNRTGKTRDLFKKIRDTKGTFHTKMGSIKDRNGVDLTEAEDIKKRWQEYTEELHKKDLHDLDNHDGVITHLEPDILEYEVKWALENITMNKASGGDGIPLELFHILKDDTVKVLHSICQQIWKTQQWPQDWKRSVFMPIPEKGNAKECSNYHTIALISHCMLLIPKSNLPIFQLLDGLQLFSAQYTLTGIIVHVSLSICEEHHSSPHPGVNLGAQQIRPQFSLRTARLHWSWLYRVRTAPSILYEIISSHPCQPLMLPF